LAAWVVSDVFPDTRFRRIPADHVDRLMESAARRAFISESNWFEGAPGELLDRLAESSSVRDYAANTYLWSMGEVNTEVFGVVSGRMRMYIASTMGQEFALIDREQGAWLGEACLLDDEGRLIGARAMEPSRVLVIPRQALKDAAEDWPQLYRNLFFHQVLTSRGLYVLYSAVLFYPLKARVAGRLLDLLREHGRTVNAGILLDMKVSQNDFARLAMGSRQRVNRIFRDWDRRGLVISQDDRLLVTDIPQLEQEVEPFE
jgi:CRP-like cAMP-binding protein